MAVLKAVIPVILEEAKFAVEILQIEEGRYEGAEQDETIKTWTAKFENGYEADIKLCNGDTPYIDSVLFNPSGSQVCVLEISEELIGEYVFECNGDQYEVDVVIPDSEWERTLPEDKMEVYLRTKGYDLGDKEAPEFVVDSTKTFDYAIAEGFDWIMTRQDNYLFFQKNEECTYVS